MSCVCWLNEIRWKNRTKNVIAGFRNFFSEIVRIINESLTDFTVPSLGYYSWRNTAKGSWFMQCLCQELKQNGKKYDILTLLTFVCQRVAINFESNNHDNMEHKHIPCITTMLTRLLRFSDK